MTASSSPPVAPCPDPGTTDPTAHLLYELVRNELPMRGVLYSGAAKKSARALLARHAHLLTRAAVAVVDPIGVAVDCRSLTAVEALVHAGVRVPKNTTLMRHLAAEWAAHDTRAMLALLDVLLAHGANPNAAGRDARGLLQANALHLAVEQQWPSDATALAVVRRLLAAGADPNALGHGRESVLLHLTNRAAHPHAVGRLVRMLVHAGADPNRADTEGWTPLMCAALAPDGGLRGAVGELLAFGADPKAVNIDGETVLAHVLCRGEALDGWTAERAAVASRLLQRGADVNRADAMGWTPLHLAVREAFHEAVDLLLAYGADVNAANHNGSTPLLLALEHDNEETPLKLIAAGADPNARDREGDGALHMAVARGRTQVALRLLEAGADPTVRDRGGWTALDHLEQGSRRTKGALTGPLRAAVDRWTLMASAGPRTTPAPDVSARGRRM